jgi:RHH-type proline utilization regulon transcriptional repressor/proline dehydrogenase/delta 1-pyrroline-5-carboxylate dehydrogenase
MAPPATEELFGPVLGVLRARDLDQALELANALPYALTGGVFSRSPGNLRRVASELRAGNVYLNRHITGAVVGRQPFGGYGLSGVGAKAGGPDHLLWLTDPRVVTENTVRQGFEGSTIC